MTIHELLINDVRADIEGVQLDLEYKSPLFCDLDKIISSRSYTLSLPFTPTNLRIFGLFHLGDRKDWNPDQIVLPRKKHKVRYFRNGIPIVTDGLGIFMGVEKGKIQFAFTFGNRANIEGLFDKNLQELPDDTQLKWDSSTELASPTAEYGFALFDTEPNGISTNKKKNKFRVPVARASWILQKIAADNNLSFWGENEFEKLLVPIDGLNATETTFYSNRCEFTPSRGGGSRPDLHKEDDNLYYYVIGLHSESLYDPIGLIPKEGALMLKTHNAEKARIRFKWKEGVDGISDENRYNVIVAFTKVDFMPSPLLLKVKIGVLTETLLSEGGSVLFEAESVRLKSSYDASEKIFKIYADFSRDWESLSLNSDENIRFCLILETDSRFNKENTYFNLNNLIVEFVPEIKTFIYPSDVPDRTNFSIMPNLPEMKQGEFLKGIMKLNGLFAHSPQSGVVEFVSATLIRDRKAEAADWSGKLINAMPATNMPEHLEFSMSEFAHKNWYRWKEGEEDELKGSFDAAFTIDSETSDEEEAEVVSIPFAPSGKSANYETKDGTMSLAKIAYYATSSSDFPEKEEITPRILKYAKAKVDILTGPEVGEESETVATEKEVMLALPPDNFETILKTKYADYIDIVRSPRIIKVRCILNEVDLMLLDMTRPVYLEQFGHYYAILSATVRHSGESVCSLIEI